MSDHTCIDLPAHAHAAGPDNLDEIGAMLLMLSAHGETNGYTWGEAEHLVELRVEDSERAAVEMISGVLDDLIRKTIIGGDE